MKILVKATIALQTRDTFILPGETVTLDEADAQSLIQQGFAKLAEGASASVMPTTHHDKEDKEENDDAFIQEIVDAIDLLNKDADFSKSDGKPHTNALSHVLDEHVTATQRDRAWECYQQRQTDNA